MGLSVSKVPRRVYVIEEGNSTSKNKIDQNSYSSWILHNKKLSSKTNIESFNVQGVLGEGLLGSVRMATLRSENKYCVLKCMSKAEVQHYKDERHIINERVILERANHPFIVHIFCAFQDKVNVYLCLEMVPGGELFRYLKVKRRFDPPVAKFYSAEIFLALEYIHSLGWVYRDVKPENVLLDGAGHVRLVDFGFARQPDEKGRCYTRIGTPQYISPEQINSKKEQEGYSAIVDWWAFGCLLFELLTGRTPFARPGANKPLQVYKRILKGKITFPKYFDKDAKELVRGLLSPKLKRRICNPFDIKAHAWFRNMPWSVLLGRRINTPYKPSISFPGDSSNFDKFDENKRPVTAQGRGKVSALDRNTFVGF